MAIEITIAIEITVAIEIKMAVKYPSLSSPVPPSTQALAVIEENMASVMTHGTPQLQAKTLFLRARCHVSTTAKYGDEVLKRAESFRIGTERCVRRWMLWLWRFDYIR